MSVDFVLGAYFFIGISVTMLRMMTLKRFGLLEHLLYIDHDDEMPEMLRMSLLLLAGALMWPLFLLSDL